MARATANNSENIVDSFIKDSVISPSQSSQGRGLSASQQTRGRGRAPRKTPPVKVSSQAKRGTSLEEREATKRMLIALERYPHLWDGTKTGGRGSTTQDWQAVAMETTGNCGDVLRAYFSKVKRGIKYRIDQSELKRTVLKHEWKTLRQAALEKVYQFHPYEYWAEAEYLTRHWLYQNLQVDISGEYGGDYFLEGEEQVEYSEQMDELFGDDEHEFGVYVGPQVPAALQDHLYAESGNGDETEFLNLDEHYEELQRLQAASEIKEEPYSQEDPENVELDADAASISSEFLADIKNEDTQQQFEVVEKTLQETVEDPSSISATTLNVIKVEIESSKSSQEVDNSQAPIGGVGGASIMNPLKFLLPKIGSQNGDDGEAVETPQRPAASDFGITEEEMEKRVQNFKTFQKHLKETAAELDGDDRRTEFFQKMSQVVIRTGTLLQLGKSADEVIQHISANPL